MRDVVLVLAAAALAGLFLRFFVLDACYVPSVSMEPALLSGDYILVDKLGYGPRMPGRIPFLDVSLPSIRLPRLTAPRRGDVIVFDVAGTSAERRGASRYVKRIVAVPGDTVMVRGDLVAVNGVPVLSARPVPESADTAVALHMVLPRKGDVMNTVDGRNDVYRSDHYFVLGDNREASVDSRSLGPITSDQILGKALVIFWSREVSSATSGGRVRWGRLGTLVR